MSFLHPEFFYYLLPPLFILFGLLLTQQEAQLSFFSEEVISKLRVSANTLTIKARNALFLLMAIFIVVALSEPVINNGEINIKAKSSDIMIALDISDSMLAQDVYPNRLKFAKQKAMDILKTNVNERIGVVAFAKNSYLVSPLSFDHSAVEFLLSQLNTTSITEQGTDFMSLLQVVASTSKNKKHLLILSDGGDKSNFSDEIEFAKKNNIIVFVLGIGTKKGAPIKLSNGEFIKQNGDIIVSKLNQNISKLAIKTGGVYIEGVNSDIDVKTMINEIKSKTKEKELKSEKIKKFIPLFYYPLGFAIILLLIATSSIGKRQIASLAIISLLSFSSVDVKAGVLDFMQLHDAKQAYETDKFNKASNLYENYAQKTDNAQSYYDAGNAYYKEKNYKKAIDNYKKASFSSDDLKAKNYANLGNAYAKSGGEKNLLDAKNSYEKSLKLEDDKDVKENLEEVKKAIKKKKEKKKKQNKKNKDKKKQDKKDNKQKKQDKKKNQKQKDKDQSKKDNNKQKQDKKNKDKGKDKKDKKKSQEEKKEKSKEQKASKNKSKMSDLEEKKWLKKLNMQKNTYMYKLNKTKSKKENNHEKPW